MVAGGVGVDPPPPPPPPPPQAASNRVVKIKLARRVSPVRCLPELSPDAGPNEFIGSAFVDNAASDNIEVLVVFIVLVVLLNK